MLFPNTKSNTKEEKEKEEQDFKKIEKRGKIGTREEEAGREREGNGREKRGKKKVWILEFCSAILSLIFDILRRKREEKRQAEERRGRGSLYTRILLWHFQVWFLTFLEVLVYLIPQSLQNYIMLKRTVRALQWKKRNLWKEENTEILKRNQILQKEKK